MLKIIHSIDIDRCPECQVENFFGKDEPLFVFEESDTVVCTNCGATMMISDEAEAEEKEQDSCPHCHTVGEVLLIEGRKECQGCGLDPSRMDYGPRDLSRLWKYGTGIRNFMERGMPSPRTGMFRFLTNYCGPHCNLAKNCPQDTKNFVLCRKEEEQDPSCPDVVLQLLQIGDGDVGRRRGRKRKQKQQGPKQGKKYRKDKASPKTDVAILECAAHGWWHQRYMTEQHETEDSQKPEDTGGGSGTQEVS